MALITTKGSYMLRKIASLSVALIVAGGVMVAVPAQAATKVSNGVTCTKSGSTTKVGSVTYRCAKNPLVTSSSKLTWLTVDCLTTANAAVKAQKTLSATSAQFKEQILKVESDIAEKKSALVGVQKARDAAPASLQEAKDKLAAAKTAAVTALDKVTAKRLVDEWEKAVKNWTDAVNRYPNMIRTIESGIRTMELSRQYLINKPAELVSNISIARENAKLFCTKGL
jgi:hypothetical protein